MPNQIIDNGELMNRILSLACPAQELANGWAQYRIELHCVVVTLVARVTSHVNNSEGEFEYAKYEIQSVRYS
jgi:hypothetical protein